MSENKKNAEILNQVPPQTESHEDTHIKDMRSAQLKLCKNLVTTEFDCPGWLSLFNNYINEYERIFYSPISQFILSETDDNKIALLLQNINDTVARVDVSNKKKDNESLCASNSDPLRFDVSVKQHKLLLKFLDHCNLAAIQRDTYHTTQENVKGGVEQYFNEKYQNEYDEKIKPKLDYFEKSMTTQLVSLVAIFTALSFVIFGSISILDNLLNNIKSLPLLRVIFIGNLWMLCMINIFSFFAKIIFKFIEKEWALTKFVIIGNATLLFILAVIIITYIKAYGLIFVI